MNSKHSPPSNIEKRREAHTKAEQKRRDEIKKGYQALQELVPNCQQSENSGYKLNKATILQRSTDYMESLLQEKMMLEDAKNEMRKDVIALSIMQTNYEQILKVQQSQPGRYAEALVSDEIKFSVFEAIMDQLFLTFNAVSVSNFSDLSGGVFRWVEEYCKPQALRDTVCQVLRRHNSQMRVYDYD